MKCQRCQSNRVAEVTAKCSDCCGVQINDSESDGYVPNDLGIGGGDYVEFLFCLDCGQLQGNFPLPPVKIEEDVSDEQVVEFFNNYIISGSSEGFYPHEINLRRRLINSAKEISFKFGKFVEYYFDANGDRVPRRKHPTDKQFLEMYRNNNYDLNN